MNKIKIAQCVYLRRTPQNRGRDHELEVIVGTRPPQFVCCLVNLAGIEHSKLAVQVTGKWNIAILSEAMTLVAYYQDDIVRALQAMRAAPPMIDLGLLSSHLLVLLDQQVGLTAAEAAGQLAAKDRYAGYSAAYLLEPVRSLLDELVGHTAIRCDGDRYFAYQPVAI